MAVAFRVVNGRRAGWPWYNGMMPGILEMLLCLHGSYRKAIICCGVTLMLVSVSFASSPFEDVAVDEVDDVAMAGLSVIEPDHFLPVQFFRPSNTFFRDDSVRSVRTYRPIEDAPEIVIYEEVPTLNIWAMLFYFWPEIITLAIGIIVLRSTRRIWKMLRSPDIPVGEPYCLKCRYQLTGIDCESCPECGAMIQKYRRIAQAHPRRVVTDVFLFIIALTLFGWMSWVQASAPDDPPGFGTYVEEGFFWGRLPREPIVNHWLHWDSAWCSTFAENMFHEDVLDVESLRSSVGGHDNRVSVVNVLTGTERQLLRERALIYSWELIVTHGHLIVDTERSLIWYDTSNWERVFECEMRTADRTGFSAGVSDEWPTFVEVPHMAAIALIDPIDATVTMWEIESQIETTINVPELAHQQTSYRVLMFHPNKPQIALWPDEGVPIVLAFTKGSIAAFEMKMDEAGDEDGIEVYVLFHDYWLDVDDATTYEIFNERMSRPLDTSKCRISNRLVAASLEKRNTIEVADLESQQWVVRLTYDSLDDDPEICTVNGGRCLLVETWDGFFIYDLTELIEKYPVKP